MKKASQRKIPILDIPCLSAFQHLHGNTPEIILQGTRAVCMFDADDVFYALSARYNDNEPVNVLDFCNAQRQLKAQMFALKARGQRS
jgi:hypothetical protein